MIYNQNKRISQVAPDVLNWKGKSVIKTKFSPLSKKRNFSFSVLQHVTWWQINYNFQLPLWFLFDLSVLRGFQVCPGLWGYHWRLCVVKFHFHSYAFYWGIKWKPITIDNVKQLLTFDWIFGWVVIQKFFGIGFELYCYSYSLAVAQHSQLYIESGSL